MNPLKLITAAISCNKAPNSKQLLPKNRFCCMLDLELGKDT